VEVKLPIRINVYNVSAIFLASNKNSSETIKHVDIRYHFVREMIDDNFLEITFVPTDNNIEDIFTTKSEIKKVVYFQERLNIE
jgi:hypothetical protein